MRWEKVGTRNLRLIEISDVEREQLNGLLSEMRKLKDAKAMVSQLKRDVLGRGFLENYKLNQTETIARLSKWCHTSTKYKNVMLFAEEVSKLLFAGRIPQRLVDENNKPVDNAVQLLDEFIAKVMRDQENYVYEPEDHVVSQPIDDEEGYIGETETPPTILPPTTPSVERDLRKHIACDPTVIEEGLKTIGEEYTTDVGRIDVLCEDSQGNRVVVELKKGRSGDKVVGQTLRYMGWLKVKEERSVRGIIILGEPDDYVCYAVSAVPDIEVKYYRVHFEITDEPPG